MDPQTVQLTIELVKMLIELAFQEARKSNMTEEEMMELLEQEREKYRANIPSNIPET